jgi:hypothetical protein
LRAATPFRLHASKAIGRERCEIAVRFEVVFKAWANDEVPLRRDRPTGELTAHEPPVR